MSDKIIEPSYFNINNKENSILKNAKHQDNEFIDELNKIENIRKFLILINIIKNTT